MLTAIGRASAQRALARGSAPVVTLPLRLRVATVASRSFTTSPWAQLATKASSTKATSTKKKTTATAAKKTATKTKAVKKKAAPKPKPKPKPKKVKKVVTPEQKLKEDIKKYKALALLDEPKRLPDTPWTILTSEGVKAGPESIGSKVKALSDEYKNLSGFRKQELQDQAEKNKLENNAAYKAWVEKHTPNEIYEANVARRQLRRKLKTRGSAYRPSIRDDRLPKSAQVPYALFCKARWGEGDLTGQATEAAKQLGREWKELGASQKKVYEDLAAADHDRYKREMLSVLGKEVKARPSSS